MTNARISARRALIATAAFVVTSCTFPEYIVPGETSSTTGSTGGAGTTSSVTSSAGTPTSSTTSSGSAGGGGSSSMSSTGSMSGPTCSQTCDKTDGATCNASCAGSADPDCDCDNDGEIIDTPACVAAHPSAQLDCYDCHPGAKHGITAYSIFDRGDGSFDFNCSNLEEPQYTEDCGEGALGCSKPYRYGATPGCGQNGDLFACTVTVTCKKAAVSNVTPQACH